MNSRNLFAPAIICALLICACMVGEVKATATTDQWNVKEAGDKFVKDIEDFLAACGEEETSMLVSMTGSNLKLVKKIMDESTTLKADKEKIYMMKIIQHIMEDLYKITAKVEHDKGKTLRPLLQKVEDSWFTYSVRNVGKQFKTFKDQMESKYAAEGQGVKDSIHKELEELKVIAISSAKASSAQKKEANVHALVISGGFEKWCALVATKANNQDNVVQNDVNLLDQVDYVESIQLYFGISVTYALGSGRDLLTQTKETITDVVTQEKCINTKLVEVINQITVDEKIISGTNAQDNKLLTELREMKDQITAKLVEIDAAKEDVDEATKLTEVFPPLKKLDLITSLLQHGMDVVDFVTKHKVIDPKKEKTGEFNPELDQDTPLEELKSCLRMYTLYREQLGFGAPKFILLTQGGYALEADGLENE